MTSALKVTETIIAQFGPWQALKSCRILRVFLSLWGYFKVNFLWNKALFLPHRCVERNLSVLIEPEIIIASSLICESVSQILKHSCTFSSLFLLSEILSLQCVATLKKKRWMPLSNELFQPSERHSPSAPGYHSWSFHLFSGQACGLLR